MAMGWGAIGLRQEGDSVAPINGTSFSAPILAGLVACLWQLHPDRTGHEVMDAVRRSAHLWSMPNDSMGYGIPDFMVAHALLTASGIEARAPDRPVILPSPFSDALVVSGLEHDGMYEVSLLDAVGRVLRVARLSATEGMLRWSGLEGTPSGICVLRMERAGRSLSRRVVKW